MESQRWLTAYVALILLPYILMMDTLEDKLIATSHDFAATFGNDEDRTKHFKFKSRKFDGKVITVMSLKLDPERGRRSILVPDGEGFLHPASFAHIRHPHRFISPFEDEDQIPLNKSLFLAEQIGHKHPVEEQKVFDSSIMISSLEETLIDEQQKRNQQRKYRKLKKENSNKSRRRERKQKRRERRMKKKEKRKRMQYLKRMERKGIAKKRKKTRKKMTGNEACQYKILRKCAKKQGLLPRKSVEILNDFQRCSHRKRFLECVEKKRERSSCKERTVARGNLSGLRTWIKKLFWTSNSCLLNEALKGR